MGWIGSIFSNFSWVGWVESKEFVTDGSTTVWCFLPRAKLCSANIWRISAVSVTACESVVSLFPYYHTEDVSEVEVYIPAKVLKRLFKLTCVHIAIYLLDKIMCCNLVLFTSMGGWVGPRIITVGWVGFGREKVTHVHLASNESLQTPLEENSEAVNEPYFCG